MNKEFNFSKYSTESFQTKVIKPWGYEIIYTPSEAPAVGKILNVTAGKRLSLQYHDEKIETLCLVQGEAMITLLGHDGQTNEIPMELDKGYFIQPGQIHRVRAITDIVFIESSLPETGNTFRLEDDSGRKTETEEIRKKDRGWTK